MTAETKIQRALSALMYSRHFFYSTLAMKLRAVENAGISTMQTDGKTIEYSPAFVDQISHDELVGVIVHEISHVANLHHVRRGNRDPEDWNRATDYAINSQILSDGFKLPDGALVDPVFDGMSADEIYSALARQKPQGAPQGARQGKPDPQGQPDAQQPGGGQQAQQSGGQGQGAPDRAGASQTSSQGDVSSGGNPTTQDAKSQGQSSDPGRCGGVKDAAAPGDEAGMKAAELEAMVGVIQAVAVAKMAGEAPGWASAMVEEFRKPKVDWRAVLRRFVDSTCQSDFSWSRPNRRHLHAGLYLPGTVADGFARLGVLVDTSGSIDLHAHSAFFGELQAALDEVRPEVVQVVQCDTVVHDNREYGPGDEIDRTIAGGGGTDMSPGLREFAPDATAIICFTDCDFPSSRPPVDPGVPVLWARWGKGPAPAFGEVIDI